MFVSMSFDVVFAAANDADDEITAIKMRFTK